MSFLQWGPKSNLSVPQEGSHKFNCKAGSATVSLIVVPLFLQGEQMGYRLLNRLDEEDRGAVTDVWHRTSHWCLKTLIFVGCLVWNIALSVQVYMCFSQNLFLFPIESSLTSSY